MRLGTSVIFCLYLATDIPKVKRLQCNLTSLRFHLPYRSTSIKYGANVMKLILRNKALQKFYVKNISPIAV